MSRAKTPSKRPKAAPASSAELATVGIDTLERLNRRGDRRGMVRGAAPFPTEPHPANLKLVGPCQPFHGYPSVAEWLRAGIKEAAERHNPACSSMEWWAWFELCEHLVKRIERFARFADDSPITSQTIVELQRVVRAIRSDLDDNRSPW